MIELKDLSKFYEVTKLVRKLKKTVLSTNPILIKMAENEFVINFGSETVSIMERYYKGLDLLANDNLEEAEQIFKSLVNGVRGYYDSIIALINIFSERGDFPNIAKLFNVGIKDLKLIMMQLPENGTIPFTYASNKAFLKFLYKLGVKHINTSRINDAIHNFELLLKLNPADEFDIPEVLIAALFEKGDYERVIELTQNISDKKNPSTIFNRILAFLQLSDEASALPLIKSLSEENLKIYKSLNLSNDYAMDISEYISFSVIDDKSKYYWNNYYRYWAEKDEFLAFLSSNISDTSNISSPQQDNFNSFKNYLVEQDLKEATIKGHLDNVELFADSLNSLEAIENKFEALFKTTAKTTLAKYITSLNKYFTFSLKENSKDSRDKLKNIKIKYNI